MDQGLKSKSKFYKTLEKDYNISVNLHNPGLKNGVKRNDF